MNYKAGDKIRQTINCSGTLAGRIYTVKCGEKNGNHKEMLWIWDKSTSSGGCNCKHSWEPVQTRSSIGKRAYKTFLKNGGTRDSKGRFSKKEKLKSERFIESVNMHLRKYNIGYFEITKKEELFFYPKKQEIDWKKIGEDIEKAYLNTPGRPFNNRLEFAKAFAKVFKKHGLIREGVEI